MTRRFYIATMPRSGSAWLANLFNVGPTISTATHEAIRQSWKADHSIEWPEVDWPHGVIGCDLALWPGVIPPGNMRLVVVQRDDDEVAASMRRLGVPHVDRMVEQCRRGIEQLKRRKHALVVDYFDLFDVQTLELIQNRIGVWLDHNRIRSLLGVNVQANTWSPHYTHGPGFEAFLEDRLA